MTFETENEGRRYKLDICIFHFLSRRIRCTRNLLFDHFQQPLEAKNKKKIRSYYSRAVYFERRNFEVVPKKNRMLMHKGRPPLLRHTFVAFLTLVFWGEIFDPGLHDVPLFDPTDMTSFYLG